MGQPNRRAVRRGGCAALLAAGLLLGTTACGADDGARPVTLAEAQRLSLARLSVYESGPAAVRLRVPVADTDISVEAVVDYAAHRASGSYRALGHEGRLAWDTAAVSVSPGEASARAGGRIRWSHRSYTHDPLDRALRLVLALGSDHPENAQLLARSGPKWLGEDRIGRRAYTRFAGPRPARPSVGLGRRAPEPSGPADPAAPPVTYWVDGTGSLGRVEARLMGAGEEATTVDFTGRRAPLPPGPWPSPVAAPSG
ncbi:hypothetical protein ACFWXK_34220 [Streptomyces sp. NPDC059070]|uniref:hypothetical protein n=1 Tax=unclassified Streptomyces TaxID=2593676 RepID=UPI0034E28857